MSPDIASKIVEETGFSMLKSNLTEQT